MDRVSFDFESGQIIIDADGQHGILIDIELGRKRADILAAAGLSEIPMDEFRKDINSLFDELDLNSKCEMSEFR